MIAWWGWLIIWLCLSLAVLVVLAASVISLFRKGIAVLSSFGDLASTTIVFDGVQRAGPEPRTFGVLEARGVAQKRWDARMQRRADLKLHRRARRLDRARQLTKALTPIEH
jgi:hypothetical protein